MKEQKVVKINLQVKRRRATLNSPAHAKPNASLEMTKAVQQHPQFLQLTINNKRQCSQPSNRNPQSNQAKISEFNLPEDPKWDIITKQVILNDRSRVQPTHSSRVFADISMFAADKMRKESKVKEKKERQMIFHEIKNKEKQIDFYQKLLVQKQTKFQLQAEEKIKLYEQCLQNLIQLYQSELERGKILTQAIGEQQDNEMYKQRRRIINKQGKMGLNYTPRRISLLKGVIADSPLLSQSSLNQTCEQKLLAGEHFSFGSKAKANHILKDPLKEYALLHLDKMDAARSRKINFDDE